MQFGLNKFGLNKVQNYPIIQLLFAFGNKYYEILELESTRVLHAATVRGLVAAVQYSTVLYVEDMAGLNDGTVYNILTALGSDVEIYEMNMDGIVDGYRIIYMDIHKMNK